MSVIAFIFFSHLIDIRTIPIRCCSEETTQEATSYKQIDFIRRIRYFFEMINWQRSNIIVMIMRLCIIRRRTRAQNLLHTSSGYKFWFYLNVLQNSCNQTFYSIKLMFEINQFQFLHFIAESLKFYFTSSIYNET